jgi:CheY-like chemotaxis protein
LLTIINGILDFSKIEAGKLEIDAHDFDLPTLMQEIGDMFALGAREKGLELLFDLSEDLPDIVKGDANRIRQILNNLIGNAIKFTANGDVLITVRALPRDDALVDLRFDIRDSGIGIPADKIKKLFQPFTQVDASTTRNFGGTGLGLSISKKLIELMNGEIGVESEASVGSNFWFRLPVEPREKVQTRDLERKPAGRVLIIDDNQTSQQIMAALFQEAGFTALLSGDADGAFRTIEREVNANPPIEMIVLDDFLPDVRGLDLASQIGTRYPQFHQKMILMAAGGEPIDVTRLKNCGISALITKPVQRRQLFTHLNTRINQENSENHPMASQAIQKGESGVTKPLSFRHYRILLVEDNLINQDVAMTILRKNEVEVDAVINGLEAVRALEKWSYDLVLMDMQMPVMDGIQATHIIRDLTSSVVNHHIPIVAMTANAMRRDQDACLAAGMDDYLSKPFNPSELIAKVLHWAHIGNPENEDRNLPVRNELTSAVIAVSSKKENTQEDFAVSEEAPIPAIQFDLLCNRVLGDQDMARDLLHRFSDRLPRDCEEIEQSVEREDWDRVKKLAHKLKGSAGNLSALPLHQVCEALEHACAAGDITSLIKSAADLRNRGEEFQKAAVELF